MLPLLGLVTLVARRAKRRQVAALQSAGEDAAATRRVVAECCEDLGEAMRGIDVAKLDPKELLQTRGW